MEKSPNQAPAGLRTFASDHRDNPALHRLHVRGAYGDLKIAQEAIAALQERSRVPASCMAGALRQAMVQEIEADAAAFEAAALLFAGLPAPEEPEAA